MFRHWLLAVGRHSLHEPFIYDFYDSVIADPFLHSDVEEIEQLRNSYRHNRKKQDLQALGAASRQGQRSFRQLAFEGSTRPSHAQILYRISDHIHAKNIIELGTSLGFTSLYLTINPEVHLITLEGDPLLVEEAGKQFNRMKRTNIQQIEGNIDDTFIPALEQLQSVDMLYVDANHRYEPTVRYFEQALNYVHDNSVMVFDDIHWSAEMTRAWEKIRQHERVTMAIDLYQFGIVFFKPFRKTYYYRLDRYG
jgi:predicted O-methyltransferase YrrM